MTHEGHGPSFGCTYQSCGNPGAGTCPFTKDAIPTSAEPVTAPHPCNHEWRQHFSRGGDGNGLAADGFYCIHCLTITTSSGRHDIVTVHNRGEAWMD